jgi:hypothetical protein
LVYNFKIFSLNVVVKLTEPITLNPDEFAKKVTFTQTLISSISDWVGFLFQLSTALFRTVHCIFWHRTFDQDGFAHP